jgi:hypothetical protein
MFLLCFCAVFILIGLKVVQDKTHVIKRGVIAEWDSLRDALRTRKMGGLEHGIVLSCEEMDAGDGALRGRGGMDRRF